MKINNMRNAVAEKTISLTEDAEHFEKILKKRREEDV